jgi:cell division protein FtsX
MLTRPIVAEVLLALGIGFVTYTGFDSALTVVKNSIQSNLNSLPADIYNVVLLSGVLEGMGIVLSAIAARLAYSSFSHIQRIK